MKTINKFHLGAIMAIVRSIMSAIRATDYKKAISKIAKLVVFANKNRISLEKALPASVFKLIKNFTFAVGKKQSALQQTACTLFWVFGWVSIGNDTIDQLKLIGA